RCAFAVVQVVALRPLKEFRRIKIVDRVSPRTILPLKLKQLLFVGDGRHEIGDCCAHNFNSSSGRLNYALTHLVLRSFTNTRAFSQRSRCAATSVRSLYSAWAIEFARQ